MSEIRDTTGHLTRYRADPDGSGLARAFKVTNPDFNVRSLKMSYWLGV